MEFQGGSYDLPYLMGNYSWSSGTKYFLSTGGVSYCKGDFDVLGGIQGVMHTMNPAIDNS